jgi:hypothetical protein
MGIGKTNLVSTKEHQIQRSKFTMKHSRKLRIAGVAFSAMFALSTSNTFACNDAERCLATQLQGYNAETWVGADYVLAADEEWVPGYETPGEVVCNLLGEPIGEGYEQTELPDEGCEDGLTFPKWSPFGKRQERKKRKTTICVPFTGTVEYALGPVSPTGWYEDRGVGGCGQEVNRYTFFPVGKRCGPTSARQDCQ